MPGSGSAVVELPSHVAEAPPPPSATAVGQAKPCTGRPRAATWGDGLSHPTRLAPADLFDADWRVSRANRRVPLPAALERYPSRQRSNGAAESADGEEERSGVGREGVATCLLTVSSSSMDGPAGTLYGPGAAGLLR